MSVYWSVFTLLVVALTIEVAIYLRVNSLKKWRAARKLRRSINYYG